MLRHVVLDLATVTRISTVAETKVSKSLELKFAIRQGNEINIRQWIKKSFWRSNNMIGCMIFLALDA
jgi:hypothetical protein